MAKTINLTDKNDKKTGSSADEIINAKGGNDTVDGGAGNDKLDGGSGNDQLTGGKGNDTIIGGDGKDTAVYAGALEDRNGDRLYSFELNDKGQLRVIDLSKKEGVDIVDSVESLKFKDQTVAVSDILDELTATPPLLTMDPTSQSVNEGTGGDPTEVTINLSLSSPSTQPVSVRVSTQEGTAKPQSDYIPLDQVITFEPGETDQILTVSIAPDSAKEGSEQFTIQLDQPQGLEIDGNGIATIGIIDDDSAAGSQVGIQVSDVKIAEGNSGSKTATVTVSLTGSSPNKVTVNYATLDGSATAGSDYQSKSGTLTFNPGETQKTINITINGDTQAEGDETFSLNLSNPQGAKLNTSKATVTIQDDDGGVQPSANHAPIPKDDSFSNLPAGKQVVKTSADLLANDQDPDGDSLAVTQVAEAEGGVVSLNDKGQIIFTPSDGAQSGSYSYTVSDGKGGTATANVLLQFAAPENHSPQAQDDSFTALPGNQAASQTAASLLKNDSDPDGDTLTVSAVGNAVNGSVSLDKDLVTFTPQTGAVSGSYQYTISDGKGGSATATVKLGFVLPNQAPDAVDDNIAGKPANQALTISAADLLKNDNDPDKNPLSVTAVSNPQNGTVALKDGQITFTPAKDATNASFQYQIDDGQGGRDSATVLLQFVLPENHAPQAQDDSFTGLIGNQAATQTAANLLKNDSDPDNDALTVTAVGNAQNGTASLNGDLVTFTPQTGATEGSYQYTVSDGKGGSASATVKLGFVLPNQAPNAVDDSLTGKPANQPLAIAAADLLKNDTDPDKNPLTVSAVSNPQNGTVALKDGQITFTPAQDATTASFQYQISDGQGGSDTATVSLGFTLPAPVTPPADTASALPADTRTYDLDLPLTDKADKLDGSPMNEKLRGLGGDDWLNAHAGNDHLDGGDGKDSLYGEAGDDYLLGGAGDDSIKGGDGDGNDSIDGGQGNDTIYGGGGNDVLAGGEGDDYIGGDEQDDTIYGGAGNDRLYGGYGTSSKDSIMGGAGNDEIGTYGQSTIDGGEGDDVIYAGDLGVSELIYGGDGNDNINARTGSSLAKQQVYGGNGNDTLSGGDGELYGEAGKDTLFVSGGYSNGGEGNDTLTVEGSPGEYLGGGSYRSKGIVTLEGGLGADTMSSASWVAEFRYTQASDSGVGPGNRDIITDFDTAVAGEVIDLGRLASAGSSLNFIAMTPFSGKAGEVNYSLDMANQQTIVAVDLDGNKVADMEIELTGIKLLAADDFILTPPAP